VNMKSLAWWRKEGQATLVVWIKLARGQGGRKRRVAWWRVSVISLCVGRTRSNLLIPGTWLGEVLFGPERAERRDVGLREDGRSGTRSETSSERTGETTSQEGAKGRPPSERSLGWRIGRTATCGVLGGAVGWRAVRAIILRVFGE